jgi:hypothetical protein
MADGTTATAQGDGNIRYRATNDVALSSLIASGDEISVIAHTGNITDNTAGEAANITGAGVRLYAGGSIGDADGSESDDNAKALNTAVDNLEAWAAQNVYIEETNALTVGGVDGVDYQMARFDSGTTDGSDGDLAGVTGSNGVVKIKSGGALTVSEAVDAGTDALLLTTAGDIEQNAGVSAGGDLALIAAANVDQKADLDAGDDVYVEARGGSITMADGTTATAQGDGNIRYRATNDVALSSLIASGDEISVIAHTGNITDNTAGEAANITGAGVRLYAGGSIGDADGSESDDNAKALNTAVDNLEAWAAQNVYIEETNALTVGGVDGVDYQMARFDSGTTGGSDGGLAGVTGSNGVVKIKSGGALTVSEAVDAGTDALILTTAGDIEQNAGVSAGDDLTLIAAANVDQKADLDAGDDVYVEARGGSIAMADGTTATAQGDGNIRYRATNDVALSSLIASGDEISVIAHTGNITDNTAGEAANITGAGVRLYAGGSIGDADGSESDDNAKALNTAVDNLEAWAAQNVYIEETNALTVGGVDGVDYQMARFDSGTTDGSDGDLAGVTGSNGVVKIKSGGALTVSEAVDAGTDALLLTTAGDIEQNAGVSAGDDLTLIAAANVDQMADLDAGDDVYVEARGGSIAMATNATTVAQEDAYYKAQGDIEFSRIEAGSIALQGNNVTPVGAWSPPIVTDELLLDVASAGLITGISSATVAIHSTGNLTISTPNALNVGSITVTSDRARFDSGETEESVSLSGIGVGGSLDLDVGGTLSGSSIRVEQNADVDSGSIDALNLLAVNGTLNLDAGGTSIDDISGGNAKIDVSSLRFKKATFGTVQANIANELTGDSLDVDGDADFDTGDFEISGDMDVGGNLTLDSGRTQIRSLETRNADMDTGSFRFNEFKTGSLNLNAGDISMGRLTASRAVINADGSVRDNDSLLIVDDLSLSARGDVGSGNDPIHFNSGNVRLISGNSLHLVSERSTDTRLGLLEARRGSINLSAPNLQYQYGFRDGNGSDVNMRASGGINLDINGFVGTTLQDDPLEVELGDGIRAQSRLTAEGSPPNYVFIILEDSLFDGGSPTPNFSFVGDSGVPGFVIINGQMVAGDTRLMRKVYRTRAFTVDTPELKSKQGIFGVPVFMTDDMDISESMQIGSISFLNADQATIGADPELPMEANQEIVTGGLSDEKVINFYSRVIAFLQEDERETDENSSNEPEDGENEDVDSTDGLTPEAGEIDGSGEGDDAGESEQEDASTDNLARR